VEFDRSQNRKPLSDRPQDDSIYTKKVKAGKRRTYYFDVRQTRGEDYFVTITENTKRGDDSGFIRNKILLYKEDFNRFTSALNEVVSHVKIDLLPEFDYEEFDRRQAEWEAQNLQDKDGDMLPNDDKNTPNDEMSW
jgi:Protein of unknown function (DUF3276)